MAAEHSSDQGTIAKRMEVRDQLFCDLIKAATLDDAKKLNEEEIHRRMDKTIHPSQTPVEIEKIKLEAYNIVSYAVLRKGQVDVQKMEQMSEAEKKDMYHDPTLIYYMTFIQKPCNIRFASITCIKLDCLNKTLIKRANKPSFISFYCKEHQPWVKQRLEFERKQKRK